MGNIATAIVDRLIEVGVQRIYGLCGDSVNGFTEALAKRKEKIAWVPVRHEETAAFAAGAEAHLTSSLTVCIGSCGPGNLHLINGLYDCFRNRVPVLAIATHIPSGEIGSGYFQETHPNLLYQECTSFCETLTNPNQLPHLLEVAMQVARFRSTVSMLVISGDIALAKAPPMNEKVGRVSESALIPSSQDIQNAAKILNQSSRVAIFGGAGCKGAHAELLAAADRLKAPIVHALRGKEHIEYDNPFDVGMTGLLGFSSGYHALMDAETLLILGTDFPYRQFYPPEAKIIHVDCRPEIMGRRAHVDYGLIGHVKETLAALLPHLTPKQDRSFLDAALAHYRSARESLDDLAKPGKPPIHPQYLAKTISDLANDDAIFTCDVGTPTIWAARYLRMNGKRRLIGSFSHGSMACALPQALGAQLTYPKRQVITLSGDGGFSMLMGDLLTIRQCNAPVKIVIFNNGSYNFIELEMKASGILNFGTDLNNPNFAKMAEAIDIYGVRIEDPNELASSMKKAFAQPGPAIIDVVVNRFELSMPPHLSFQQIAGFNIWMAKAALNGRGNEILELAKTNLFR
jgi:pyruvate dehydrogenase (quinone)